MRKCLGGPPPLECSGLEVESAPSPVSLPYFQAPLMDLQVTALAQVPLGAAEGSEVLLGQCLGEESSEGLALPGGVSILAIPLPILDPLRGALHSPTLTLEGKGVGRGHRARRGPWGR